MSCEVLPGEVVVIEPGDADRVRDCYIHPGAVLRLHYQAEPIMDPIAPNPVPASEAPADLREVPPEPTTPDRQPVLSTSELADGTPDLTQLEGLAGGNPALMLALAVLVIVGGGAGWRFWTKMSEQRHEQAMAKLALEREMAGLQGAQPPPCQTAAAKMQREIDALEKRVGKVERRPASPTLPDDFDADDLIARVAKLEKAAKVRVSVAKA